MMPTKQTPSLALGDDAFDAFEKPATHQDLRATCDHLKVFSKSSNAKSIIADVDYEKRLRKFETKMSVVLSQVKTLKLDEAHLEAIFVLVLQTASDYLHSPDPRKIVIRNDVVVKLLAPFTKDDGDIARKLIQFVSCKIKPSTLWRRNKAMVKKCVLFFLKKVVGHI